MSEVPSSPNSNSGQVNNAKKKPKNQKKEYHGVKIKTPKRKRRQMSQEGEFANRKVRFDQNGGDGKDQRGDQSNRFLNYDKSRNKESGAGRKTISQLAINVESMEDSSKNPLRRNTSVEN